MVWLTDSLRQFWMILDITTINSVVTISGELLVSIVQSMP